MSAFLLTPGRPDARPPVSPDSADLRGRLHAALTPDLIREVSQGTLTMEDFTPHIAPFVGPNCGIGGATTEGLLKLAAA